MVERRIVLFLLGLACMLGVAFGATLDRGPSSDEALGPIERWERLSESDRERLRSRFELYQQMSEEERRELADRARNVHRTRQRLLAQLSDEEREHLRSLTVEQREAIVSELVEDDLKAQGKRLHAKLPEEWRELLERATPEERRVFFTEFKARNRMRISLIALDNLGRQLGLPREEVRAMQRLPDQERLGKVLELRKQLQLQSVETYGLPAGLTPERWSQMLALEAQDFFEAVMHVRETGGWRADTIELEGAPEPEEVRRRHAAWDLLGELRPRPGERLELAALSPTDRRAEVSSRRRERAQAILVRHEAYPADRLTEIEALADPEFYTFVRNLVRESGALDEPLATR